MERTIINAIPDFIKYVVEERIGCEGKTNLPDEYWIERTAEQAVNDYENYYNFYDWADSDVKGRFENPYMLLNMVMEISNYFKENFDMDWISTKEKLDPQEVINAYVYMYCHTEIDINEMIEKIATEIIQADDREYDGSYVYLSVYVCQNPKCQRQSENPSFTECCDNYPVYIEQGLHKKDEDGCDETKN